MTYSDFIQSNLEKAGKIANGQFGHVAQTEKIEDSNQVLTKTDLEIGSFLVQKVQTIFPSHNIIDEEAGVIDKSSEFTWVIDPIDGTSNFAKGLPHYGIMIGLLQGSTPIAGGVILPSFGEIYIAEKGNGVTCNGKRISVSDEISLGKVLVTYGIDGHREDPQKTIEECEDLAKLVLHIRNLRTTNSAYDMMACAKGAYGLYMNKTTKIWDNVAPHIIIEEAGGVYTDFYGKTLDYSTPLQKSNSNYTVCAGSKILHDQVQAILRG
ncbi:MAG: inositol monophosphatase [Candidatus Roizmanbacteria bacterium]